MAGRELPAGYLEAGAEYLDAVQKLGLRPRFAGWGWEEATELWLLVLATSIYDAGGPLETNKLLFKAYNAGATPKTISPFIVRVFSPEILPQNLFDMRPGESEYKVGWPGTEPKTKIRGYLTLDLYGTKVSAIHMYEVRQPKARKYHDNLKEWHAFRRNVEKLAA
jgi:hypothetical protein